MEEPVDVGKHGDEIRSRVEELHRTVNDREITLPEMELEEIAFAARVMADRLGELFSDPNHTFLNDIFESLQDRKRAFAAREAIREILAHTGGRIAKHPNYERRAERMKHGHNSDE